MKILNGGALCCLADNLPELFRRISAGEHCWREIRQFDAAEYGRRTAGVLSEQQDHMLGERYPEDTRESTMIRCVAEQALANTAAPSSRLLLLASNFGQVTSREWSWREKMDTGTISPETYAPVLEAPRRLAKLFGCREVLELNNSCSSGATAFSVADSMLRTGTFEQVLIVAYDAITEFTWGGLNALRTVTRQDMCPFDKRRSGTIFSEGAAAVLLGRDDAEPKEKSVYVTGCATNNNAFHLTAPCKDGAGSLEVMSAALKMAGVSPVEIDGVVAHATSTSANDSTEAAALLALFGGPEKMPPVAAWKASLGHLLGAAGLTEALLAAYALRQQILPVCKCEEPDHLCAGVLQGQPRETLRRILVNSAGIGGNNAALVLSLEPHLEEEKNMGDVIPEKPLPQKEQGGGNPVRGYLDSTERLVLEALRSYVLPTARTVRRGLVVYTKYSCETTGYGFFSGLLKNGPRHASPMLFPHTYANMPGCQAAIEFGLAGPHVTFVGSPFGEEAAVMYAKYCIAAGQADEMLVVSVDDARSVGLPERPDGKSCISVRCY